MLLFICEQCGAWADVSLADAWAKAWEPVGKALVLGLAQAYNLKIEEEPVGACTGWACPVDSSHGLMRAVSSEDRLSLRPAMTEQGEEKMNLRDYVRATGLGDAAIAFHVQKSSGLYTTCQLITQAMDGEAITLPRAQALCEFLSKQFGRSIQPSDISDLKIA